MTIGERIKNRRKELDLTLEDVANKLKITRQTVQKYESGIVNNIPSDKIEALAVILKTTPAYLMGWENKPTLKLDNVYLSFAQELSDNKIEPDDIRLAIETIKSVREKHNKE